MSDTIGKLKNEGSLDLAVERGVLSPELSRSILAAASNAAERVRKVEAEAVEERRAKDARIVIRKGASKTEVAKISAMTTQALKAELSTTAPEVVKFYHSADEGIAQQLADELAKTSAQPPTVLFDVASKEVARRTLTVEPASN